MKKITLELTDEQINSLINGEEVVVLQSALVKPKSDLEIIKEKYESRDYIAIYLAIGNNNNWYKTDSVENCKGNKYKLIHKKHIDILDTYLKDNSVEIEVVYSIGNSSNSVKVLDFIDSYDERLDYILQQKEEYPQFKVNKKGEVFRLNDEDSCTVFLSPETDFIGKIFGNINELFLETIPYDKERGLYHKQPVWCVSKLDKTIILDFYDIYTNMWTDYTFEPITLEQLKVMPFIWGMYKQLEAK